MRVIMNREPRKYKIADAEFLIKPCSKDDMSKAWRESLFEKEKGGVTVTDEHVLEIKILTNHITGWEGLMNENDEAIPYSKTGLEQVLGFMDQADRQELFYVIISPAKNREKLVAAEKNA